MLASESKDSRDFFIFLFQVLLVLLLISVFLLSLYRKFDQDEIEAVHTGWKILNGEKIFLDFFQHHHPFFYQSISPIISVVGENVSTLYTLRVIMYGFMIGILVFTYRLTQMIFDSKFISWLTVLLMISMSMFSRKAIEIRPDVPQIFFAIAAFYFLFQFKTLNKKSSQYLSAFLLALSFLILQKTLFICFGIVLVQLYWLYRKDYKVHSIIQYWSIFILSISPYYLLLLASNEFENYFLLNWILNMHFEFSFSAFKTILDSLYYNHFNWALFLYGLVVCIRNRIVDIPILSLVLLGTVFLVKAPYRQYFMPFIPFMCMIVAYGIYKTMNYKLVITVVLCTFITPTVYNMLSVLNYPNKGQLEKMMWVLATTSKDDYVYDGKAEINLYRRDIDYFWFSTESGKGGLTTFQKLKPYDYNLNEAIFKYQPKILSDLVIKENLSDSVMQKYTKSNLYPDLYIMQDVID